MPLLAAAFAEQTKSGDCYAPRSRFGTVGLPRKIVSDGKPIWWFFKEKSVLDEKAMKKLWEVSEAAVGEKFLEV